MAIILINNQMIQAFIDKIELFDKRNIVSSMTVIDKSGKQVAPNTLDVYVNGTLLNASDDEKQLFLLLVDKINIREQV